MSNTLIYDAMEKERPEDDIRNATNERLAEMLEEHNKWRRGEKPYDGEGPVVKSAPFSPRLLGQVIDEAARRLRVRPVIPFNHEQFE